MKKNIIKLTAMTTMMLGSTMTAFAGTTETPQVEPIAVISPQQPQVDPMPPVSPQQPQVDPMPPVISNDNGTGFNMTQIRRMSENGTTYLALRDFVEFGGYTVNWDNAQKAAVVNVGNLEVVVYPNQNVYKIAGETVKLGQPVINDNGTLYFDIAVYYEINDMVKASMPAIEVTEGSVELELGKNNELNVGDNAFIVLDNSSTDPYKYWFVTSDDGLAIVSTTQTNVENLVGEKERSVAEFTAKKPGEYTVTATYAASSKSIPDSVITYNVTVK